MFGSTSGWGQNNQQQQQPQQQGGGLFGGGGGFGQPQQPQQQNTGESCFTLEFQRALQFRRRWSQGEGADEQALVDSVNNSSSSRQLAAACLEEIRDKRRLSEEEVNCTAPRL